MKADEKKELLRTIKYFLVAASAGIIQFGTYALFLEVFHWKTWITYLLSLILSVLWNYTINRRFTFKSTASIGRSMALAFAYYLVFTPISTWWTKALVDDIGWNAYLVEIATMLVNGITEFLWQRFFIYRGQVDNREKENVKKA